MAPHQPIPCCTIYLLAGNFISCNPPLKKAQVNLLLCFAVRHSKQKKSLFKSSLNLYSSFHHLIL